MSCPEHLISQLGRQGVGVIQPQSGLDYPLVAPSEDIRYLIADFHLSLENDVSGLAPFYISNLYGVGCVENAPAEGFITPVHAADILVRGTGDEIVFDSSAADTEFEPKDWGNNYRLYNWKNEKGVCNLLVYTSWADTDGSQRFYDKYLTPQNGRLDARAVYVTPRRLLSIRVGTEENAERMAGKITFVNGYNTELTAADQTIENFLVNTNITVAAAAGSGKGKYSTCGDNTAPITVPIKKINGVSATAGDFLISATDCLYVRVPTSQTENDVEPNAHLLEIGAVCAACCQCDDYVELARNVNQYRNQYAYIGARVTEVKNIHEQNIDKWVAKQECAHQNPLRVSMVAQKCPFVDVAIEVCNSCGDCLPIKEIELIIKQTNPRPLAVNDAITLSVVEGGTSLYVDGKLRSPPIIAQSTGVGCTKFVIPFHPVKPGSSLYVRFRLRAYKAHLGFKSSGYAVSLASTAVAKLTDDTLLFAECDCEKNNEKPFVTHAVNLFITPSDTEPDAYIPENTSAFDFFEHLAGFPLSELPPAAYPPYTNFSVDSEFGDGALVTIDDFTGIISFLEEVDRETKVFYKLKISYCQCVGRICCPPMPVTTREFLFKICDVNEYSTAIWPPQLADVPGVECSFRVGSGNRTILQPSLSDGDHSKECSFDRFSLAPYPTPDGDAPIHWFDINTTTGEVRVNDQFPAYNDFAVSFPFQLLCHAKNKEQICADNNDSEDVRTINVNCIYIDEHDFRLSLLGSDEYEKRRATIITLDSTELEADGLKKAVYTPVLANPIKCPEYSISDGDSALFTVGEDGAVYFKNTPNLLTEKTKYTFIARAAGFLPAVGTATVALNCSFDGKETIYATQSET
jgi:hypothetical protein